MQHVLAVNSLKANTGTGPLQDEYLTPQMDQLGALPDRS